ncbi:hypothetical protein [Citricoccus sp. NR2]|uniref:hypothetical protein n=1 Tax=Citricoccus sp. NR2 TaxID=3004095 RepID=UPI0022DE11F8|nr:hypothetical protein [Citricoccus sp. NR2]WBL19820.1 hypothetical protein O1A05_03760 [Citricoccus sp. NR2]
MTVVPLHHVQTHHDVPLTTVEDVTHFTPWDQPGVSKYRADLPKKTFMDALLINKSSDVLVVVLHGSTDRKVKTLPRFEWMRTLRETDYSTLYFSDPCLWLHPSLELAWYTGWKELDLYPVIADWIARTAQTIGAQRIIITGSSGGGLASLQIATYIPGSIAMPFNAQTAVSKYRTKSVPGLSPQRNYLRRVMPHLQPDVPLDQLDPGEDWSAPLGARLSAVTRYRDAQPNRVHYVQNSNDDRHMADHYQPFQQVIHHGPNQDRVRFRFYDGPAGHVPPLPRILKAELDSALAGFEK